MITGDIRIFRPSRNTVIYAAPCAADRSSAHNAAWFLLDQLLQKEWNLLPENLTVIRTDLGKPVFAEGFPHFSLSHSSGYAAAVLSDRPVGIDLEKIRPISDRIVQRYLYLHPMLIPVLPGMAGNILAWTRLESYGKLTGRGFLEKEFLIPCQFSSYYDIPGQILTVCEAAGQGDSHG